MPAPVLTWCRAPADGGGAGQCRPTRGRGRREPLGGRRCFVLVLTVFNEELARSTWYGN